MIVVTGAAGLIGSHLVRALNAQGSASILAVDNLRNVDKFRNLVDCQIVDYLDKADFLRLLHAGAMDGKITAVLHQGACSDTMCTDGHYLMENNYRYSLHLLDFCQHQKIPLIYASSAAVYGGSSTFREQPEWERPLNGYGYSKLLFDQQVRRRLPTVTAPVVGLRYFNVYGTGEAHKGRMASVAFHLYEQYYKTGILRLFAGSDGYADGAQLRDFISVEDVVQVNLFFLARGASGVWNCGTGQACPFNAVALSVLNRCRQAQGKAALPLAEAVRSGEIQYIDFPEALRGKYQSYTQADLQSLRAAGYTAAFTNAVDGVDRYVAQRLAAGV